MFGKDYVYAIIKGFFRLLIVTVILLVVGVLVWRFITATPPKELMTLSPNDKLVEQYEAEGNIKLVTQKQENTITSAEYNYGYFSVADVVFIPEIQQLQVLVKYNDSTLKALKKDYAEDFAHLGEKEYPDSNKDWYDVSVVLAKDRTPENKDDNLESKKEAVELVRIMPTEVSASMHKGRYNYRRLIFDNVPIDELTLAVYADFYYIGDVAYTKEDADIYTDIAYGTLCLYSFADKTVDVKLTKDAVKAIENYG